LISLPKVNSQEEEEEEATILEDEFNEE